MGLIKNYDWQAVATHCILQVGWELNENKLYEFFLFRMGNLIHSSSNNGGLRFAFL